MKTQEWSLWRILCLSGLPWYGVFVGLGLYLQRQYNLGTVQRGMRVGKVSVSLLND